MQSHTRQSPGIEINEIDRSRYGAQTDYSITGTTVLVAGFADKGETRTPTWVSTTGAFENMFGIPTNEPERYLYNAAAEVISRGGRCVAARLPYDNMSLDKYASLRYKVVFPDEYDQEMVAETSAVDPSLTSYFQISGVVQTKLVDLSALDQYRVSNRAGALNEITVVDVRREKYGQVSAIQGERGYECLGLMPVFTAAADALYYQGIVGTDRGNGAYAPVVDAANRKDAPTGFVHVSSYSETFGDHMSEPFAGDGPGYTKDDQTVSKDAASFFPLFSYVGENALERRHLKRVGLVVFEVYKDPSNENRVGFQPVESFVGSLDKRAKDPRTGATDYIGDVVNAASRLVNVFTNVDTEGKYRECAFSVAAGQTAAVLGFAESECVKHMDYEKSFVEPLTRILDACQDPNQVQIDLVADAGVTTLAQYAADNEDRKDPADPSVVLTPNSDAYPFLPSGDPWTMNGRPAKWHAVMRKFDEFCKYVRRDCMFLADAYRPLVLAGNEKVVRMTDPGSSIERDIMPNLRYLHALDSSYSAGYCDWFYQADAKTGDFFWVPPSVKAAGVYVYTDAYFHTWDAPAGLTRGVVRGAFDVAFDPRGDEAGGIYKQAWNYAVNYPVEGVVIEGQKTFQIQQTALDRVNVRRLMLYLEKTTRNIARRFLYEGNTPYLRQRFVDMLTPVFDAAVNGKGVKEYAIRCDDQLNTDDVVERNELRCVIGIKPVKSVEWIVCNFIVSNQSADITEEVKNV